MIDRRDFISSVASCAFARNLSLAQQPARDWNVEIEQITRGPKHHFFGYIGHVRNTPWNGDGRYITVLQTGFQDRMPSPGDAAGIALIDTKKHNEITVIDESRGWNPQQGTMLYWNPKAAGTQLIFNDRDPKTNRVFTVLYDISARKRIREYRYDDTPFGNSGVAQNGGYFLGINYGRLARLRPVTGYPGAYDWTSGDAAPDSDGIFITEIETGNKRLLVSFRQLAGVIRKQRPDVIGQHLFINHTLWNRSGDRIYFYARANFSDPNRINVPFTIKPDGSGLTMHTQFIGGHPEWETGSRIIGEAGGRQIIYDVDSRQVVGQIGTPEIIPQPGGDIALSPDGNWFVNGWREGSQNFYVIIRRSDGAYLRTRGFPIDRWTGGDLRLDAAPCWNRGSDRLAVPAIASDRDRTRQTFLISIRKAISGEKHSRG